MCGCLSHGTHWGPGPQPRYVPWLGIELVTLWFRACAQSIELHQPGLPTIFYSYKFWVFSIPFSQPSLACTVCHLAVGPLHSAAHLYPLLPVWMNVSLTPWLLEFHAVWFYGTFGCLLFLNRLLSFFWLCEEANCFYLCFHLGRTLDSFFLLVIVIGCFLLPFVPNH